MLVYKCYKGWAGYIKKIYTELDFPQLKQGEWCDLDFLSMYSSGQTHDDWWGEAQSKPKDHILNFKIIPLR